MSTNSLKTFSHSHRNQFEFGKYADSILEKANNTFSVIHNKFLKERWGNNRDCAKLRHNQCFTDWENGRYEVYIPTRDNVTKNLSYYRIAIQVQSIVSNENKKQDAEELSHHMKEPLGEVESELLILVAPRQHHWGLVKAFKHRNAPGYFTAIFVNSSPEIVWKRVLCHIANFIEKRLKGLFMSLGLSERLWEYRQNTEGYLLYYSYTLAHFSMTIRQSAHTFLWLFSHLRKCLKQTFKEIGLNNMALEALKPLKQLNIEELTRVFNIIREKLSIELKVNVENQLELSKDRGIQYLQSLSHSKCYNGST